MGDKDFSDITNKDPRAFLQGENAELKRQVQQLQAQLNNWLQVETRRGDTLLGQLVDAFNLLRQQALQGNPEAQKALLGFMTAFDAAKQSVSRIILPNGPQLKG